MKATQIHILILKAGYSTRKGFAEAIGIDPSTVYEALNGHKKISRFQAAYWAAALNCGPEELSEITIGS